MQVIRYSKKTRHNRDSSAPSCRVSGVDAKSSESQPVLSRDLQAAKLVQPQHCAMGGGREMYHWPMAGEVTAALVCVFQMIWPLPALSA